MYITKTALDLDRFLSDCRDALSETSPQTLVREVLARAVAEPSTVIAALGEPQRAGVGKLYHAEEV